MSTRILIVDDHPLVRQGLIGLISTQPDFEVCGEASGIAEAQELVGTMQPEVVIIDLTLKDGNGIELIKALREQHDDIRMLVISMHDESLFAERALRRRGRLRQQARGDPHRGPGSAHRVGGPFVLESDHDRTDGSPGSRCPR